MTNELEPLSEELFKTLETERARPPAPADQLARLASRLDTTFAAAVPAAAAAAAGVAGGVGAKLALVALGLAVGAIGGAQLQAHFGAAREVIVERVVERVVEKEVRVEVPVRVQAPTTAPTPRVVEEVPRAPMELERLLVEQATSALGRGQGGDALAAVEEHARRFPKGQLVEERESVAIRALVLLNRKPEALARAERFRIAFPDSLLLEVVNEAVR